MDIPLALEYLTGTGRILATDDWGPGANTHDTYEAFAAGWRGASAVPTQVEMDAAWAAIEAAGGVAEIDAERERVLAKDGFDETRVLRAIVEATLQELNALRQWIADFKATTAAANSLADFKVRVAALSDMPQRTAPQVRTAIRNGIDTNADLE